MGSFTSVSYLENRLLALGRLGWEISSLLWRKYRAVNPSKLL